jgi:hypothetical protein
MSNESESKKARRAEDKRAESAVDWTDAPRFTALGIAETWAVTVEAEGQMVLSIGSDHVAGLDGETLDQFAPTIRSCAQHLLAFAGAGPIASTAGAAKGGNTSLEGLARFGWTENTSLGMIDLLPRQDGAYVKFADVERLLANAAPVPPLTAPAPLTDELPAILFDGHAVYSEITRHLGRGHCFTPDAVSTTLDAVVRLMRAERKSAAPAPQQSELNDEYIYALWSQSYTEALEAAGFVIGNGDVAHMNHPIYFARAIERVLAKAAPAAPVQTELSGDAIDTIAINAGIEVGGTFKEIPVTSLSKYARAVLKHACVAAPVQAEQAQAEPVKLPSTPEEMIAFIGSQFEMREDAEDPSRVRFVLTVHDLLSAFDWWFDGAPPALPAQAEQAAAVRANYERAAQVCQNMYEDGEGGAGCAVAADRIRALAAPGTATSNDTGALGEKGADRA